MDGERISSLLGIDPAKYTEYWNTDFVGDEKALLSQLDKGRNIILSETLKEKYGLETGDTFKLRLRQITRAYTIIGFMNTMLQNRRSMLRLTEQ